MSTVSDIFYHKAIKRIKIHITINYIILCHFIRSHRRIIVLTYSGSKDGNIKEKD